MDERELERIAPQLGADAADRIDVQRVAQRVVAELRKPAPPVRVTWWRRTGVLRAAAAVAVLMTGGVLVNRMSNEAGTADTVAPVELEQFSAAQLDEVLDSLDLMTSVAELAPASLDDLNEAQLQALLEEMEG